MMKILLATYASCITLTACFVHPPKICDLSATTDLGLQRNYLDSLSNYSAPDNAKLSDEKTPVMRDPYAPGVAESYGLASSKTQDGFDASADTVGPSIYGGSVQRDANGCIIYTSQYQENDHHKPGPLYDGNGYSLMARAIHVGPNKVVELLNDFPQLIQEVSTGGATPLHICGMSERGQHCTQTLVDAGADVHALDSYNYNALHRMASNDLKIGAEVLVKAGVDPNGKVEEADSTPIEIARRQRAIGFLMEMQRLGHYD
jgi:hypothetical protein